jgi:hypothetical protein
VNLPHQFVRRRRLMIIVTTITDGRSANPTTF